MTERPRYVPAGPLGSTPEPPRVTPDEEPPETGGGREAEWVDHDSRDRDRTPALGTRGEPGPWRRAVEGAAVTLQRTGWADAAWSYLFKGDTRYAAADPAPGQVRDANRRMRTAPMPETVQGPFIKAPVWTWEVPLYFWFGGIAAGSSFVALACDAAGDGRSAATARKVALAAALPSPPLLIADLGRPARFLNMLRIFKPRSPMNTGAWCLAVFSGLMSAAVAADLLGRPRAARAIGAGGAVTGGYLGSYAGILLATTAVPLWARSRLFLGPIFVATATATGASASRLALVAGGLPVNHPTRNALGTLETGAIVAELALATINQRRLRRLARPLHRGRSGRLFKLAEMAVVTGLALRFVRGPLGPRAHHVASVLYLAGGLAFRYAWVEAGKASARDDEAVAWMGRGAVTADDAARRPRTGHRMPSSARRPLGALAHAARAYGETVGRLSLAAERLLRR